MSEIKANEVYTPVEAEKILKVSKSTIKRMLKNGLIRANKIGGQYRILGHEILRLLSPVVDEQATKSYQNIKAKTRKITKDW